MTTTWRDLADQLTPKQVDGLANMEGKFTASGIIEHPEATASLMDFARQYAEQNLADAAYGAVPLPPGATAESESWSLDLRHGGFRRSLEWATFGDPTDINAVHVGIDGWQKTDGTFTRYISIWGLDEGGQLTTAQVRVLAAYLVEAADEMDRLA